jgi:hypothetical protein
MAQSINRLSARTVSPLKVPGKYADGAGLYLEIDPGLAKRWTFIFQWRGQRKQMGLGSVSTVSLAEAKDPERRQAKAAKRRVNRGSLPADLPRIEQIIDIENKACPCCAGALHRISSQAAPLVSPRPR